MPKYDVIVSTVVTAASEGEARAKVMAMLPKEQGFLIAQVEQLSEDDVDARENSQVGN